MKNETTLSMAIPHGLHLPFSKSLIDFLLTQDDEPQFSTSDWLKELTLADLFRLIRSGGRAQMEWESNEGTDFLTVLVNAAAAERRVHESPYPVVELQAMSGRLMAIAYSEMNRRLGSPTAPKLRLVPECLKNETVQ